MNRLPSLLFAALLLPGFLDAQAPVRYHVSFPNAAHHEAEITVVFSALASGPLEVRMSRTSPGRYALHEFAKNVYNVRAIGAGGRPVEVARPDLHQWTVSDHGGEVRISYTLFGDRADGTYAGIDETHGHLNVPAAFLWARGLEARPVELTVEVPEGSGWRVATQLVSTEDPYRFTAPDLAYFMDSPVEVSDFWESRWEVPGPDGPQTVRIALHHEGTEAEAERYARGARAIVDAEAAVYGGFPSFDHGTYTFLACYLPWADGDGMEHRNSTMLTSSRTLAQAGDGLLGTVAHEFFHAWNTERIRGAGLEPFDLEAANVSRELWFGEGITSYYTPLAMWRAGLMDDEAFARSVGGTAEAVENARGRRYFSAVEMSMQAPFVDAAVSVDPTNRANTFLSYYTWGAGIGLALDLTLRTRFENVTLDHLMRDMWDHHGDPEVPFTVADVEASLARVTGDAAFARAFFHRYVEGTDAPDYATLFGGVGVAFGAADPGGASLGPARLDFSGEGARVVGSTLVDTPLYRAGVDRGDVILEIAGRATDSREAMDAVLRERAPGDTVRLRFRGRGSERTVLVTLGASEALDARMDPEAPSSAVARRNAWKRGIR